jgi:hypothetical protein
LDVKDLRAFCQAFPQTAASDGLFSSAFQLFRPTGFVNPAPWSVLLRTVTPAKVKILAIEPIVNSSTIRMLDGILYAQDPYRR